MEKLKAIYSKTYNFVYLRAKCILEREEDAQELVKDIYVKAIEEDVREDRLISWLGKKVYVLGCSKYRKKKAREASHIELKPEDYDVTSLTDLETTKELICDTLQDLPDMYFATVFALYQDQMTIKEIASVMGYNKEVIVNRINYVHKYLQRVLERYKEENDIPVQFSVEALGEALQTWTEENALSELAAKSIYGNICKELGTDATLTELSETDGGLEKRVSQHDFRQELTSYQSRIQLPVSPKLLAVGVIAILILLTAVVLIISGVSKKEKEPNNQPDVEQNQDDWDVTDDEFLDDSTDDTMDDADDEPMMDASEYILPNSNTVRLTEADIQGLSLEQLRLARNEIFARHGTIFGVSDLAEYFGSKSWYTPTISFDEFNENGSLNEFESANLKLIVNREDELNLSQ